MSNRSISGWLVAVVFLGIMVGVIGGGLMGGLAGYYVVLNRAPAAAPAAAAQLAAVKSTAPAPSVTNIQVNETSAIVDTVKKTEPGVVTVVTTLQGSTGRSPFGQGAQPNIAEGSGVIIDNQGHIVTNQHVIDGATQVDVIYADGTKASAKIVGQDTVSDLAVLQVTGNVPGFVSLGDSNSLQLGETVIAIGSPLGSYRSSVTAGVVSGLNRSVDGTGQEGLIQTDAAINHGNSGGPLLNLDGQVIGINTLVVRDTQNGDVAEGLGFAIPSNTVSAVVKQLIATGKVTYPFIGISYNELTPQTAGLANISVNHGALVTQVSPGSPAAKAGLQVDDVVTSIDGTPIDETHSLRQILFQHQPGDTVKLSVLRNGQTSQVDLTLAARPDSGSAGTPG